MIFFVSGRLDIFAEKNIMEHEKSLLSISHDHFHIMMVAQIIKKDSAAANGFLKNLDEKVKYAVHFFDQELANHFYLEEHIFQPLTKGISEEIDELLEKMKAEHKNIELLVRSLKNKTDLENKLNLISSALENHIQLEERILFPKIKESLSEEELEALAAKLNDKGYENIYKN